MANFGQCEWQKIPMYEWQCDTPKIKMMYKNLNDFLTEDRYIYMHSKLGANTIHNNCLNIILKATWVFSQVTRLTYFKKKITIIFFQKSSHLCFVFLSNYLPPSPTGLII
jgi:hypothetical protein